MPKPKYPTAVITKVSQTDPTLVVSLVGCKAAPSSQLASWTLEWDDGSYQAGSGVPPATPFSRSYLASDVYRVRVTVVDRNGMSNTASLSASIWVNPPTPLPPPTPPPPTPPPPPSPSGSGTISWVSADPSVTSFEARIRAEGADTVLVAVNLGLPTPDPVTGRYIVDISSAFTPLPPGNYTVSVAAISPGGTSDSGVSNVVSYPF